MTTTTSALTVETAGCPAVQPVATPSAQRGTRLLTWPFLLRWAVVLIGYPYFYWVAFQRTQQWRDRAAHSFASPRGAWLPGFPLLDRSDPQWNDLRSFFPGLLLVAAPVWFLAGRLSRLLGHSFRVVFLVSLSMAMLLFLHGRAMLLPLFISTLSFLISRRLAGTRYALPFAWASNLALLLWMYATSGGTHTPLLSFIFSGSRQVIRWHTTFKISVLRLTSYAVDVHWAHCPKHTSNPSVMAKSELHRLAELSRPTQDYANFLLFLAYVFYPPLYLAGPVLTFNCFAAQFNEPQRTHSLWAIVKSFLWLGILAVLFDASNHLVFLNGVFERRWFAEFPTAAELVIFAVLEANWMYIKFLLIWRLFRLLSLVDGVDCLENLPHCVNMYSSPSVMWKNWHASFNAWTIRYVYVPLGGRRLQWLTAWLIFCYIGLWHDNELRWLAWALINCAGLFVEGFLRRFFQQSCAVARPLRDLPWLHDIVIGLGTTLGMTLLVVGNMAIALGFDWTPKLLAKALFSPDSPKVIIVSVAILLVVSSLQQELFAWQSLRKKKELK